MRAGTRRPSLCRVSIGRAREDHDISTGQAYGSDAGGRRQALGDDRRTVGSGFVSGGPTFAKKDNARRRYCTNPGRAFDWTHCVPVRATIYPQRKSIFFFVRCSHQIRLFPIPKTVDRFLRYSRKSHLLIMGYLSAPMGSCLAMDHRPMRSSLTVAAPR